MSTRRMVLNALTGLATMTLVFSMARGADYAADAPDATAAIGPATGTLEATPAPTADAATPIVNHHRSVRRLTVAQSIDESVHRLTRGLNLDPDQQEKLRQILVDQRRQMMHLRMGDSAASGDLTGTTLAIYAQAKGRIRAMLNDEQKSKYSADVPRDSLAPAQADLQHWMQLQESNRNKSDEASQ